MMKKRHILHWAMGVVMTPLLGSCATDDIGDAGREGCDIILGQPITVTSATRATDGRNSPNQFDPDEIVWLWAKAGGSEYINAWKLTAQSGGSLIGSAKYWPSDGSSLNVYALHGNFENSQITEGTTKWSTLSLTHTVESDQSSDVNKRLSDLLYSHPTTAAASGQTVELTFDHLLAKITVKLNLNDSQGIEASELANATVTLTNILPKATFTSSDGKAASAGGYRTTITAGKPTSVSDGAVIGSAIVPLQDFGGGKGTDSENNVITITLAYPDSRSFSYTPTPYVALTAGNEYIYTLKIINGELSVSSIIVNKFTTEETHNKSWDIYVEPSGS